LIIKHKGKHLADSLATPNDIYLKCMNINGFYKATLDVCATSKNSKCDFYIQKREDALKVDWNFANSCMKDILYKLNVSRQILSKPVCFCNPPHSKSKLFVEQAYNQWRKNNLDIVMLLPVNVLGSEYSKKFILPFIKYKPEMFLGRIRFLDPITNKPSKYNSVNSYFTYAYYDDRNED